MILKKLANGVRNQDWTAVAIELIVVVAGILIAVQVDRLVEGRRERALAQTYVERLLDDLAQNKDSYEDGLELVDRKIDALEQVRRILAGAGAEIDELTVVGLVRDSIIFAWINPMREVRSPAFSEITSAGNLDIFGDAGLQAQLLGYYSRLERDAERVDQMQTEYPRLVQRFAPPSVVTLRGLRSPSDQAEVAGKVDVEAMISQLRAGGLESYVDAEKTRAIVLKQRISFQLELAMDLERYLTEIAGPINRAQ